MKAFFQTCTKGIVGGGGEVPQILILGLDGVGKTTLLYRLRLPSWKDIVDDVKEMRSQDLGYHYEELSRGAFRVGMFDVPGTGAMRNVWNAFYHAMKIHCVIFIVDSSDHEDARIDLAKRHLNCLLNEDELQLACFAVIINERDGDAYDKEQNPLYYRLGLHELHSLTEWRVEHFIINIARIKGEEANEWKPVMQHIKNVLNNPEGFDLRL